jgi:hypothetical protein
VVDSLVPFQRDMIQLLLQRVAIFRRMLPKPIVIIFFSHCSSLKRKEYHGSINVKA